jgi:hypothetical protein
MPATLAATKCNPAGVPAYVRAATASCSPPPRVDRCAGATSKHFRSLVARARLPKQRRFHDLRHTRAALLIANGRYMEEMKDHLENSSIRVTSDRYGSVPACSSGRRRRARRDLPECSLGRRGRRAAVTPPAPRLSTRGRSESISRAFSGGCESPLEEPPPSAPSKKREAGGQDRGFPPFLASGPPASDAEDESGAGRIRPAASPSV